MIKKHTTLSESDYSRVSLNELDEQYTLQLFRRTLLAIDERAKGQFQRHLSKVVLGWVRLHPRTVEACQCESEGYYVVQTFASFWQTASEYQELELSTLTDVLRCLQASLNGVIIDRLRNRAYE